MHPISNTGNSSASLLSQLDSSNRNTQPSKATAKKDPEQLRIQAAAKEFEAVMLSMALKEMRKSLTPSQGLFGGDKSDTYGGMFDMFMGQSLAQNSPLGMAEMIQKYGQYQAAADNT